ncbi:hypothetical protein A2917_01335 [Candidatus Nomurabacteria bacterium RIFCSPLOWO2_01_FULL_42_17]|uniref:Aminoglycoside phosphotransferase domain-containing protein n=1 Tax=Candidatus Nomurabacteria bacterium RIFCSPLOWO2_01_FULL_42_17 TaxID=1801780 RepID=A0A1F6XLF4_9BACT|nr:MAG: hypothetical protein A2917_01335 [Candidatus Nomurabacteria bacterium RIFCSPLOWO2_01_FULL_42_17]
MSEITFYNEPKLSEHEVDQKFNERRMTLVPHVKDFISNHERFKDKDVSVTFADKGVSSLISIIETSDEKLVLRIPLSLTHTLGDAQFLKVWEQAGVRVPHVFEDGILNGHQYILMEFIDAKTLTETYHKGETINREIYVELGKILRVMHEPEAKGYGRSLDNKNIKAEFHQFKDWLDSPEMQKRIEYARENNLLGEEHGSLSLAFEILITHINDNKKSSYCHNDFGTSNTFATNPLTIFDPSPGFNDGYIDLGRSIMRTIANDGGLSRAGEQLIKGYFKEKPYNKRALQASILLNAYMKFPYGHKVKNFEQIKNVQEYLVKTKHLLEK